MKKGFTLVELIAVIVILALLVIIMTPAFDSISSNIRERNYISKKSTIKAQTLSYVEKYLKNDVYDYKDVDTDGENDYTMYLNIKENKIDVTGTGISTKMDISKALCFTPNYLIRNGIISSDDEKQEYIKNDKDNVNYSGDGEAYIKIYYNLKKLKLNAIILGEKNTITYQDGATENNLEIKFEDVKCSKIDNKTL